MKSNQIKLISLVVLLSCIFIVTRYLNEIKLHVLEDSDEKFAVKPQNILAHVEKLIEIGNSELIFEDSRIKAREYIRDYIVEQGVPKDNIIYNKFEWSERKADGKLITTTTWTGINIIIWTNTTEVKNVEEKKIRVIGGHYDTLHWGLNRTSGAHDNLSGVALIIETVVEFYKFQRSIKDETPYMFVLFDQEEPGALGSKSFVDHYKIAKNNKNYAYFVDVDAIGYRYSLGPIIQTYPYEHKKQVLFSPSWLVNRMVQSAYQVAENGIQVGHASIVGSMIYQAHRYHLHSIPYLSDDGPFTWSGVDSLLFTDLDIFYSGGNPHYHQLTDQADNLDIDQIKICAEIISHFILSTLDEESVNSAVDFMKLPTNYWSPILRVIYNQMQNLFDLVFSSGKQYLVIGPLCFNYFEILSASLLMLTVIYYTTFQKYRNLNIHLLSPTQSNKKSNKNNDSDDMADESDNNNEKKRTISFPYFESINGHRLLFIHLLLLAITVLYDTVYAFEIIILGFFGLLLVPYHQYNINVFSGIICAVLSLQFIYKDIAQINTLGRKGPSSYQLSIFTLISIYTLNSILIAFYGHHYSRKREFINKISKRKLD